MTTMTVAGRVDHIETREGRNGRWSKLHLLVPVRGRDGAVTWAEWSGAAFGAGAGAGDLDQLERGTPLVSTCRASQFTPRDNPTGPKLSWNVVHVATVVAGDELPALPNPNPEPEPAPDPGPLLRTRQQGTWPDDPPF